MPGPELGQGRAKVSWQCKAALEKLWLRSWFWLCQVLLEMGKPALLPWLGGCWQDTGGILDEC